MVGISQNYELHTQSQLLISSVVVPAVGITLAFEFRSFNTLLGGSRKFCSIYEVRYNSGQTWGCPKAQINSSTVRKTGNKQLKIC